MCASVLIDAQVPPNLSSLVIFSEKKLGLVARTTIRRTQVGYGEWLFGQGNEACHVTSPVLSDGGYHFSVKLVRP